VNYPREYPIEKRRRYMAGRGYSTEEGKGILQRERTSN
jgi:hypothetical protein